MGTSASRIAVQRATLSRVLNELGMNSSRFSAGSLNGNRGDEGAEDEDCRDRPGSREIRSEGGRGSDRPDLRGRLIGGRYKRPFSATTEFGSGLDEAESGRVEGENE